jgi:uncharacterized protein YoxC
LTLHWNVERMNVIAILAQTDPRAVAALERIAIAQTVMAGVMIIIGLIAIGGALLVLTELRTMRRVMRGLSDALYGLMPRLTPLVDRVSHVTNDVAAMTDNVRRKVDDIIHTAEDLNRSVKRGSAAAEKRVRRFTRVLDIAQTEAEDALLDAAAAARGVQETARMLREPVSRRSPAARVVRTDDDEEESPDE